MLQQLGMMPPPEQDKKPNDNMGALDEGRETEVKAASRRRMSSLIKMFSVLRRPSRDQANSSRNMSQPVAEHIELPHGRNLKSASATMLAPHDASAEREQQASSKGFKGAKRLRRALSLRDGNARRAPVPRRSPAVLRMPSGDRLASTPEHTPEVTPAGRRERQRGEKEAGGSEAGKGVERTRTRAAAAGTGAVLVTSPKVEKMSDAPPKTPMTDEADRTRRRLRRSASLQVRGKAAVRATIARVVPATCGVAESKPAAAAEVAKPTLSEVEASLRGECSWPSEPSSSKPAQDGFGSDSLVSSGQVKLLGGEAAAAAAADASTDTPQTAADQGRLQAPCSPASPSVPADPSGRARKRSGSVQNIGHHLTWAGGNDTKITKQQCKALLSGTYSTAGAQPAAAAAAATATASPTTGSNAPDYWHGNGGTGRAPLPRAPPGPPENGDGGCTLPGVEISL